MNRLSMNCTQFADIKNRDYRDLQSVSDLHFRKHNTYIDATIFSTIAVLKPPCWFPFLKTNEQPTLEQGLVKRDLYELEMFMSLQAEEYQQIHRSFISSADNRLKRFHSSSVLQRALFYSQFTPLWQKKI